MNKHLTTAFAVASTLALAPLVSAQSAVTTVTPAAGTTTTAVSTTTTAGTVAEIGADTLVIRSETSPQPIRYGFSKTTTYVDETGAPVSLEMVRSGLPVTVHYIQQGDRMIANRVVVRTQTAPAAVAPTVIERNTNTTVTSPPVVVEKPVYIDRVIEKPVIIEKKVAVPVEKKVYVDRPVPVAPAAPAVIERKTTTTTTTTEGRD